MMMFNKVADFATEWDREARMTEAVMKALTDESLTQAIAVERRTLGQLAWHLVRSIHFMTTLGLDFDGPEGGELAPESAASIANEYLRISDSLQQAVKTQWSDEKLHETEEIMGEAWSNGGSLRFTVMHQAHHRGQMTVLMKQAGLRIPELYGPTYETWIDKGMAPRV
jgi:uncharacterized damage-inducible protein DinB